MCMYMNVYSRDLSTSLYMCYMCKNTFEGRWYCLLLWVLWYVYHTNNDDEILRLYEHCQTLDNFKLFSIKVRGIYI